MFPIHVRKNMDRKSTWSHYPYYVNVAIERHQNLPIPSLCMQDLYRYASIQLYWGIWSSIESNVPGLQYNKTHTIFVQYYEKYWDNFRGCLHFLSIFSGKIHHIYSKVKGKEANGYAMNVFNFIRTGINVNIETNTIRLFTMLQRCVEKLPYFVYAHIFIPKLIWFIFLWLDLHLKMKYAHLSSVYILYIARGRTSKF